MPSPSSREPAAHNLGSSPPCVLPLALLSCFSLTLIFVPFRARRSRIVLRCDASPSSLLLAQPDRFVVLFVVGAVEKRLRRVRTIRERISRSARASARARLVRRQLADALSSLTHTQHVRANTGHKTHRRRRGSSSAEVCAQAPAARGREPQCAAAMCMQRPRKQRNKNRVHILEHGAKCGARRNV